MSDLSKFCKEVLKAVEDDNTSWFYEHAGLCYNSRRYDQEYNTRVNEELAIFLTRKNIHSIKTHHDLMMKILKTKLCIQIHCASHFLKNTQEQWNNGIHPPRRP